MAAFRPSYKLIGDAMRTATVRAGLAAKARQVQAQADRLASSEGVDLESELSEGTRPKGRPYHRVSSPNVQQEWGGTATERRRVLGRAAESSQ